MPSCNHPGATCVIGNFWICTTRGCPNSGEQPAAAEPPDAKMSFMQRWVNDAVRYWANNGSRAPDVHVVADEGIFAHALPPEDVLEIRLRRIDQAGSTWGRLFVPAVNRNILRTRLERQLDDLEACILNSVPGSGLVASWHY